MHPFPFILSHCPDNLFLHTTGTLHLSHLPSPLIKGDTLSRLLLTFSHTPPRQSFHVHRSVAFIPLPHTPIQTTLHVISSYRYGILFPNLNSWRLLPEILTLLKILPQNLKKSRWYVSVINTSLLYACSLPHNISLIFSPFQMFALSLFIQFGNWFLSFQIWWFSLFCFFFEKKIEN